MPTRNPIAQATYPAMLIPSRGPAHLLPDKKIIGRHRAANRTEGSSDDREEADQILSDAR